MSRNVFIWDVKTFHVVGQTTKFAINNTFLIFSSVSTSIILQKGYSYQYNYVIKFASDL